MKPMTVLSLIMLGALLGMAPATRSIAAESQDLSAVTYVQVVSVGSSAGPVSQDDIQAQTDFLNRCLSDMPRGRILAISVSTTIYEQGDMTGRHEQVDYQIGWARKPHWLE